ncbi:MAG: hypothetical protein SXA11_08995 [Cyanobacteriota bacterium]|nr:hypothetical protein [Cyanobacteriota bacterium]
MLTHHRKPVSLSLISTDLPVWSLVETAATLYQKDRQQFHILLHEPAIFERKVESDSTAEMAFLGNSPKPRLLWLEVSPYRAIMTMQGNGQYNYRHMWEPRMYGISRYWLQSDSMGLHQQLRLRNFTRNFVLVGEPIPEGFRLEYELWSEKVQLGSYVLELEIHH